MAELERHPAVRQRLSGAGRDHGAGGEPADPHHGQPGRQHAAAHALRILPRYRAGPECNKRNPGSGCAAHGRHRAQAWPCSAPRTQCIATYPGDFAQGSGGARRGGAHDQAHACRSSNSTPAPTSPTVETVLSPDELITGFVVPAGPWTRRSTYVKVRDRESYAYGLATAAVALHLEGGVVREARIGLGGVAYRPWRAHAAEADVAWQKTGRGQPPHRPRAVAFADAKPRNGNAYKDRPRTADAGACADSREPDGGLTHGRHDSNASVTPRRKSATNPGFGDAASRIEGRLKVTGGARYASDLFGAGTAHAYLHTSPIGRGRITGIDETAARRVPGVLDIMTYQDGRRSGEARQDRRSDKGYMGSTIAPLMSDQIWHSGQIVAVDRRRHVRGRPRGIVPAQSHLRRRRPRHGDLRQPRRRARQRRSRRTRKTTPGPVGRRCRRGTLAQAPVTIDAEYETPTQHHNPIELFTTAVAWHGDELTIWEPSQNNVGVPVRRRRATRPRSGQCQRSSPPWSAAPSAPAAR